MLPQVGQAGVVPQSLCKGHGSFVPDAIAPHPEGRGKTVKVSAHSALISQLDCTLKADVFAPWNQGLETNSYSSPLVSCPGFQIQREI